MAILTPFNELSTEAVQVTDSGDKQRVVYTNQISGNVTSYNELSAEVVVDVNGNKQRAIPVVSLGVVDSLAVESVNSQTGVVVLTAEDIETSNGNNVSQDITTIKNDLGDLGEQVLTLQGVVNSLVNDIDGVATALDELNGEVK